MKDICESAQCSKGEMYFNVGLQAMVVVLGAAALRKKPRQLAVLLVGWVLNLTAFRLRACLHCEYYGQVCHLGWGKLTARLFGRKGEPDREIFSRRVATNLAYALSLFALPVPAMWENRRLLATYEAVLLVWGFSLMIACRKCGMKDVCSLGGRIASILPS